MIKEELMALTLTPDTEERIRSVAVLRGQDPETALNTLLHDALAEAEAIRSELQASEAEFNAGGGMTLEDWKADILDRRAQRAGRRS
jgi:predicted transcriptional regulator